MATESQKTRAKAIAAIFDLISPSPLPTVIEQACERLFARSEAAGYAAIPYTTRDIIAVGRAMAEYIRVGSSVRFVLEDRSASLGKPELSLDDWLGSTSIDLCVESQLFDPTAITPAEARLRCAEAVAAALLRCRYCEATDRYFSLGTIGAVTSLVLQVRQLAGDADRLESGMEVRDKILAAFISLEPTFVEISDELERR
jgi:hypothetical protein